VRDLPPRACNSGLRYHQPGNVANSSISFAYFSLSLILLFLLFSFLIFLLYYFYFLCIYFLLLVISRVFLLFLVLCLFTRFVLADTGLSYTARVMEDEF
jgi:hypothetical protein